MYWMCRPCVCLVGGVLRRCNVLCMHFGSVLVVLSIDLCGQPLLAARIFHDVT